jgi:hypothetical protein
MGDGLNPFDDFRRMLKTVLGQALEAAGFRLDMTPIQWNAGLFRYRNDAEAAMLLVDFQLLVHPEHPSRFQVILQRVPHEGTASGLQPAKVTLPLLLWREFGVRVLPSPDHWWRFYLQSELVNALMESGKLLVGYGLPWLDGSLVPGETRS